MAEQRIFTKRGDGIEVWADFRMWPMREAQKAALDMVRCLFQFRREIGDDLEMREYRDMWE